MLIDKGGDGLEKPGNRIRVRQLQRIGSACMMSTAHVL